MKSVESGDGVISQLSDVRRLGITLSTAAGTRRGTQGHVDGWQRKESCSRADTVHCREAPPDWPEVPDDE